MKKKYQKPINKAYKINVTNIICASPSAGFGSGETVKMYAREAFENDIEGEN